jgi:hypothetical protein
LNIGGSGNAHELILDTELPITRIEERNNYRASLIAYQRQRRALQEAEDLAVQAVRGELYQLRQYADQYRLQQRQLQLAYQTIDSSLESLQAPTAPPAPPGVPRTTPADGPAALTSQLLSAQRSLPTAQNALLTLWINYLNQRLQLYRDLELMPLDARGVWIDEIRDCDCGVGLKEPTAPGSSPSANGEPRPMPELLPPPKETPPAGGLEFRLQPTKAGSPTPPPAPFGAGSISNTPPAPFLPPAPFGAGAVSSGPPAFFQTGGVGDGPRIKD